MDLDNENGPLVERCFKIGTGWFIRTREIRFGKGANATYSNVLSIERVVKGKKSIFLDLPITLMKNLHIALRKILRSKRTAPNPLNEDGVNFVDLSGMANYCYDTTKYLLGRKFSIRVETREYTNSNKVVTVFDVFVISKLLPKKDDDKGSGKSFCHDIPCKYGAGLEQALRQLRELNGTSNKDMQDEELDILIEEERDEERMELEERGKI